MFAREWRRMGLEALNILPRVLYLPGALGQGIMPRPIVTTCFYVLEILGLIISV